MTTDAPRLRLLPLEDTPEPRPWNEAAGRLLRRLRTEADLTLEQMALRWDCSPRTVAAREAGQNWNLSDIEQVAGTFGRTTEAVFGCIARERTCTPQQIEERNPTPLTRACGRVLRRWRLSVDMTARELAFRLGRPLEEVAQMEDGALFGLPDIPWICGVFHVPTAVFIEGLLLELEKGEDRD